MPAHSDSAALAKTRALGIIRFCSDLNGSFTVRTLAATRPFIDRNRVIAGNSVGIRELGGVRAIQLKLPPLQNLRTEATQTNSTPNRPLKGGPLLFPTLSNLIVVRAEGTLYCQLTRIQVLI